MPYLITIKYCNSNIYMRFHHFIFICLFMNFYQTHKTTSWENFIFVAVKTKKINKKGGMLYG